jgi:uncharacterized membrane protein
MSDGVRFFSAGPLSVIAIIILIVLLIIIIPLFVLGIIGAAFVRLGFSWISALAVILLMIFGSLVNIPVYCIRREIIRISRTDASCHDISLHDSCNAWDTSITCNLGGTILPAGISAYLLYQAVLIAGTSLLFIVCAGIIIVAAITFVSTRVVPGAGIRVPLLIPGLAALLVGVIFSGGTGLTAAVVAFASGTIGTLSGGNIANLFRVSDLEITEFSIGGTGTFGAVFICCILPAILA